MGLMSWLRGEKRDTLSLSFDEWTNYFTYNGNRYGFIPYQTLIGDREELAGDFASLVSGAYESDSVVFACMDVRLKLFAEARFQFRQLRNGRPGDLFSTPELGILETPWPGGTTGDLLARAIQDADIGGNAFIHRVGAKRLQRLRPDWMTIVSGGRTKNLEAWDIGAEVLGYIYRPGGKGSGKEPVVLAVEDVAHFAPIPDPSAPWRGMSWLHPVIQEILSDKAATRHKLKFFQNGATVNQAVVFEAGISKDDFDLYVQKFRDAHRGVENAYETLFFGGGADIKSIGADFQQIDFKVTQGAGETRIAAAAGVPPVIVGLSEGLQAATYSNYAQARRRFADGTIRPLWRNFAGSMQRIINVPAASMLWYDDRDIPFLQEDQKDAVDILSGKAQAIKALVDAGFESASVVDAVNSGDLSRLSHTGLFSVQLQPPNPNGAMPMDQQAGRALANLVEPYLNGKRDTDALAPIG